MTNFKMLAILLVLVAIYLNRSYAYFYDYLSKHHLNSPSLPINQDANFENKVSPYIYSALGDSLSAGVGATSHRTSLPYLIAEKQDSLNTKVFNLAVPGAGVKEMLTIQVPQAIILQPDLITILVGINDIHNLTPVTNFESDFSLALEQLTAQTKAKIVIINIPYLGSDKILFLPYNLLLNYQTMQINDIIKKLAQKYHLPYIDLYKVSRTYFQKTSDLYSGDNFHPSDKGYIFLSNFINVN